MKTKLLVLSAVILIPASWSCGDSGGNGTGVAGDTLVKDVAGDDVQKVCEWNTKQGRSLVDSVNVRQVCTLSIAPDSESKTECKEAVDDCVADYDEAEDEDDLDESDCEDAEKPDIAAGCFAVTIADYETCVKTLISRTKKVLSGASCDDYGEEPDFEAAADDLPGQCEVILNRCPSILPGFLQDQDEE
jgi:hypothetical protein